MKQGMPVDHPNAFCTNPNCEGMDDVHRNSEHWIEQPAEKADLVAELHSEHCRLYNCDGDKYCDVWATATQAVTRLRQQVAELTYEAKGLSEYAAEQDDRVSELEDMLSDRADRLAAALREIGPAVNEARVNWHYAQGPQPITDACPFCWMPDESGHTSTCVIGQVEALAQEGGE